MEDYCIKNNIKLVHSYIEKNISAYNTDLDDSNELVTILGRATNSKDFDIILIHSLDRLIRRVKDKGIIDRLKQQGVRIIEVNTDTEL
ncbi:recombinase family protein [Vallitalea sp.]|uniref:recombinase family protein n=1 Tax=Vallitalea sp. TaxID=1882829 RepID=UPI0025E38FB0|nr:recombinase family protein [Vallitalea sp.]MCT4686589.1 recombinase family protein [Vallitalea sp.]